MLSRQNGILQSLPEWWEADGTAGGGGHCFLGAGGCLTGVGATGSITGCESGDEGHDGGGESSTRCLNGLFHRYISRNLCWPFYGLVTFRKLHF